MFACVGHPATQAGCRHEQHGVLRVPGLALGRPAGALHRARAGRARLAAHSDRDRNLLGRPHLQAPGGGPGSAGGGLRDTDGALVRALRAAHPGAGTRVHANRRGALVLRRPLHPQEHHHGFAVRGPGDHGVRQGDGPERLAAALQDRDAARLACNHRRHTGLRALDPGHSGDSGLRERAWLGRGHILRSQPHRRRQLPEPGLGWVPRDRGARAGVRSTFRGSRQADHFKGVELIDGTRDRSTAGRDAIIRLENLTKTFPGQAPPAVEDLSMEIYEGEIVVFVGPSGCGKTTTMKMINRIIEPSGGRIFLDGEDVTTSNPDKLRRRIGYVIQQIGLFPHMTIADNIATVPKMLGWDNKRISDRIDELLETVGIDLSYRNRYPKELSGGQRQRIGVARAMAADPPVMLMDEPFGAVDPITRERLQDEFLRLQEEIRKTIVFVTHDIDEAIKMGDRIAILREQSEIAQYDTPETILTDPADEYVENFIGSGASLKRLSLSKVEDIKTAEWPVGHLEDSHDDVR